MDEELNFDDWFEINGYDESHREQFKMVWNAALKTASLYFISCEGTDYDVIAAYNA